MATTFERERSEDISSVEYYEHSVDNLVVEVVGQNWSSEVISLFFGGLGGRAGGIELPLVNGLFVPRDEECVHGELRVCGFSSALCCSECQRSSLVELSQQQSLFLTVDRLRQQEKEFGVRDMKGEGTWLASSFRIFGVGPFRPSCRVVALVVMKEFSIR